MNERNFRKMLKNQWNKEKFLCLDLDTDYRKIPDWFKDKCDRIIDTTIFKYNARIINKTRNLVNSYKINLAFYLTWGCPGIEALKQTIDFIQLSAPEVPIILDANLDSTASANDHYLNMAFSLFDADAVTVNPYPGQEPLENFLSMEDKGIFVICRQGSSEFQDYAGLYQHVAAQVAEYWNMNKNCGLVVDAAYPQDLKKVRTIAGPDIPILITNLSQEESEIREAVKVGKDENGQGMLISSSEEIIFASSEEDFAVVARKKVFDLQGKINLFRV